jgi:signal transduction histidine kinase
LLNKAREPQEAEIVERIAGAARQLAKLVTNTLTLMRADDFRRTLERAPVDLAALLRAAAEKVRPFIKARRLQLSVRVADDLGVFEVDAEKIDASVINLLTNAIKFTPDGNEVTLEARLAAPDVAEIRVVDTGIGLDPPSLEQLFQPFFTQFDSSLHSSGDCGFNKRGLGVGLSIVRQFVELHGGAVTAESAPGKGTTLTIRLPRSAPASEGSETPAEAALDGPGPKAPRGSPTLPPPGSGDR